MSQASIIINVSEQSQIHSNGLSGSYIVPGKKDGEEFAMLVVYPAYEIQDIGDQRRVGHWLKASPLAHSIVGLPRTLASGAKIGGSDAAAHSQGVPGDKQKWGIFLCEAEPDLPRELTKALEEEVEYLNTHMPDSKFKKDQDSGAVVAVNVEDEDVREKKRQLSATVVELRAKFDAYCRLLVQKKEVLRAKQYLAREDARLVAEGDRMWARPTEQQNINDTHRRACSRLGQERPWCYIPLQLVDCPGCGTKIKENILVCGHCGGFLEEGIEVLRVMPPKERSQVMYPERYAEPVDASGAIGAAKTKKRT